jgi:hypothetical protein
MAHLDIGYVFGNGKATCLGEARQQNLQECGHLGGHADCHLRQREGKRLHLLDLALALAQELQKGESNNSLRSFSLLSNENEFCALKIHSCKILLQQGCKQGHLLDLALALAQDLQNGQFAQICFFAL